MSHLIKALLVACGAAQFATGCSSSPEAAQATTTTVTETVTPTPESRPVLVEGDNPGNGVFVTCGIGGSGIVTKVTSCPFAVNVKQEYSKNPSTIVYAHSPVTNQDYDMRCETGFTARLKSGLEVDAVRCFGGNNAVVVIF